MNFPGGQVAVASSSNSLMMSPEIGNTVRLRGLLTPVHASQ
jgi:hypothetical protein